MQIHSFLEDDSSTFTHVLADEVHRVCAIIDPVLDFDYNSCTTTTESTDKVLDFIEQQGWDISYIIETHAHADHLSSARYIKDKRGGQTVIGKQITLIQEIFKTIYNLDVSFKTDASQFDILTDEGTELMLGDIVITSLCVAGHTPADMAYQATFGESMAVFVGDTIFAPDVGTARCDFPKGNARTLYQSIQRLLALPEDTELYLCHDYPPQGRSHIAKTTVGEQKRSNKHVKDGISESEFVQMREERDATLNMPRLILPAVQVNIQAGELPTAESNGVRYIKVPLNYFS